MGEGDKMIVFKGKGVRRIWHEDKKRKIEIEVKNG